MPTPLVILFWIWLLVSVAIYLSRLFKRSADKTPPDDATTGGAADGELPLDSPERWAPADAAQPDAPTEAVSSETGPLETGPSETGPSETGPSEPAVLPSGTATPAPGDPGFEPEPAVAAALAEQALHESADSPVSPVSSPAPTTGDPALPVGELASRLEPLIDESHIEPSVLQAMSPTQRAALGTSAAATGGLFDPQARAVVLDNATFDHTPLQELLVGIALPCDLLPAFRTASNDHYAIFTTTSASPPEVAAKVAAELERLGFEVSPRPPAGARATRSTSAVDIVVTMVEETDEDAPHVELEFTSL